MKRGSLKSKILYLFTRNSDLSKEKRFFSIFTFLLRSFKLKIFFRQQGLNKLKKSYTIRKGESWAILNYKRIIVPEETPVQIGSLSYVRPETFAMHCQTLKSFANVIGLNQLIAIIDSGEMPPEGTVVLTFDGGHSDFFLNATNSILTNGLTATISLPTGYIGTKALLLDDMLATALRFFSLAEHKVKEIEGFSHEMFLSFLSTTKEGVPTSKSVQTVFAIMLALPLKERLKAIKSIGKQLDELEMDLPPWEDFLSWKDIKYLSSLGFNFISMLHSHQIISEISAEILGQEISESEHMFSACSLDVSRVLTIPYGIYNNNALKNLKDFNYNYCLGSLIGEPIQNQKANLSKVLRRTLICEDNAPTKDLFLSRIWDY